MQLYRLAIDEIQDGQAVTRYTRWIDAVEVRGAQEQEVYLSFSPRFEHIWLQSKRRLLEYVARKPANLESAKKSGVGRSSRLERWLKQPPSSA